MTSLERLSASRFGVILLTMSNQPAVIGPDGIARPYIGGQALIEGVMMRSPHAFSAVVRRRDGSLLVREEPMRDLRRGPLALPLVRGVVALVEALKLGSRALRFSADTFERDLEDGEKRASKPGLLSLLSLPIIALLTNEPDLPSAAPADGKKGGAMTWLSVAFALGLFVALPQAFAQGVSSGFGLNLDVPQRGCSVVCGRAPASTSDLPDS